MKKYLVFVYDQDYPAGGINDFYKDFDSLEEAVALANKCITDEWYEEDFRGDWHFPYDHAHIVDVDLLKPSG